MGEVEDGATMKSLFLRQNLIPTPNASHWSHITPVLIRARSVAVK